MQIVPEPGFVCTFGPVYTARCNLSMHTMFWLASASAGVAKVAHVNYFGRLTFTEKYINLATVLPLSFAYSRYALPRTYTEYCR